MSPDTLRFFAGKGLPVGFVAVLALSTLSSVGSAQGVSKRANFGLEGSWSGGGSVVFASGAREQARCRAHYRRAGRNVYSVNATCATASGRASQTGTVRQVGENRYSGSFYNSEFGISGVVSIVVHGARQSVRLVSDSASAVINLNR